MLAVRRGVVGALASGDARVRRACGAVRKGARAEAGWRRAPRARAEGFMGVRLRTFWFIILRVDPPPPPHILYIPPLRPQTSSV